MTAAAIVWTIAGFIAGSVPFAYLVTRLAKHEDIRDYGSHNPGGMNVWRTAGLPCGAAVILLDFAKGLAPVGMVHYIFGLNGWVIAPIALAPVLGHAYSPWLHWRGGKAVAVSFGVWAGLLGWPGLLLLLLAQLTFLAVWKADSWVSVMGMALFMLLLWMQDVSILYLAIAAVNGLIIAQRYWPEFKDGVRPRYAREGG